MGQQLHEFCQSPDPKAEGTGGGGRGKAEADQLGFCAQQRGQSVATSEFPLSSSSSSLPCS